MPISDLLLTSYPRSTLTQLAARDRVRGDLGLRANNLLTDTDLNSWLNETSDSIAEQFRWYRTSTSINSVASTKEYPFPAGLIALEEVWFNGLPLQPMQLADFQSGWAFFRTQGTGSPIFYYVRGNSGFGLHATPGDSIVNGIFLVYTGTPPKPANDSDFYTIPYTGERALISGAKLLAAEKDSSGEGARRWEMLAKRHEANMLALSRAIESVSEGEAIVIGSDEEPELGGYRRYPFWDPNRLATPP